jgi:uncharacterized protein
MRIGPGQLERGTMRPAARSRRLALALAVALAAPACATYSDRTETMRSALQQGDYAGGAKQLNTILKVKKNEQLPDKWKKNFELVVLERATIFQAKGLYELSARDFQVADKELELLDIARDGAGKIGKYIYSDSATKYKASPVEKLSLNAMNMCNYLARGDLDGAQVEARRFTVMHRYMQDYEPEHAYGAFGSYLAGFVAERRGSPDSALRYYEQALAERDFTSLREPIVRLARQTTFRAERVNDYLPSELRGGTPPVPSPSKPKPTKSAEPKGAPDEAATSEDATASDGPEPPPFDADTDPPVQKPGERNPNSELGALPPRSSAAFGPPVDDAGEVLVVAKVGRVPFKIPRRIPIGAAIGLAGAYVTGDTTLLEYGMFKVVTYPELVRSGSLFDRVDLTIDGHPVTMDLASDLSVEIVQEYEEIKPKIIGAALTRMIARAAAAEGARAAGRQSKDAGGLIGFLAAAAVEGTLVALDKPDTRSWTTLPGRVFVGRARLPAGEHELRITVAGPGGREVRRSRVNLRAGQFVVVDVTTLR